MFSVRNLVNARLLAKLKTDSGAKWTTLKLVSSDVSSSPTSYPCLFVNSLGEPTSGSDFQGDQCYIESTVELQAFSDASPNGSATEARKLLSDAGDVMLGMGYQLTSGPYDLNNGYFRVVARFTRTIGDGDTLY